MENTLSKQEVRKLWVEALRSGKYLQGRGQLCSRQEKFCCLGVLCDLYRKKTGKGEWTHDRKDWMLFQLSGLFMDSCLPEEVMQWVGLWSHVGGYGSAGECYQSLVAENDAHESNFDKIADIIESEPEGLFID